MHITKIRLNNICCFEKAEIDLLREPGIAKRWLLIVGDNGVGKTSFLRSIAIGLCDETGAASLLQDIYGDLIQKDKKTATIELELVTEGKQSYRITTHLDQTETGTEVVKKTIEKEKSFPWHKVFVCAYGADRGIEGSQPYEQYAAPDALYTLFNYDWPLQNPELMIYRRAKGTGDRTRLLNELCDILGLPEKSISLTKGGFSISSFGKKILWGASADGYRATITLVLDMLGWFMLSDLDKKHERELFGIILIDEIEQHLHPELQRSIVAKLNKVFPNIQFIATSHSPICAAGLADLDDSNCSLELLRTNGKGWVENEPLSTMRGWRYDQILTSSAFGLTAARNLATEKLMDEIKQLYMKAKLNKKEVAELDDLLDNLRKQAAEAAEAAEMEISRHKIDVIRKSLDKPRGGE